LKNKVADLAAIMSEYQPDIVIGNESWLNPNIASSEIFPENYNVFRKDRIDSYGGVFQAAKKDLIITLRSDFDAECEIIWTHCRMAGAKTKSFLFGAFYRSNSSDMEGLIELDKSLFALGNKLQRQNVILGGDFNAPNIDWKTHHITGNVSTSEKLLEIIDKHDLCQMVMVPTRRQLSTNNVLDLVFSNNSNIVSSIKTFQV
jgi:exonuclease III